MPPEQLNLHCEPIGGGDVVMFSSSICFRGNPASRGSAELSEHVSFSPRRNSAGAGSSDPTGPTTAPSDCREQGRSRCSDIRYQWHYEIQTDYLILVFEGLPGITSHYFTGRKKSRTQMKNVSVLIITQKGGLGLEEFVLLTSPGTYWLYTAVRLKWLRDFYPTANVSRLHSKCNCQTPLGFNYTVIFWFLYLHAQFLLFIFTICMFWLIQYCRCDLFVTHLKF